MLKFLHGFGTWQMHRIAACCSRCCPKMIPCHCECSVDGSWFIFPVSFNILAVFLYFHVFIKPNLQAKSKSTRCTSRELISFHIKLNYSSHAKLKKLKEKKTRKIGKKITEKNIVKMKERGKRPQNVVK